MGDFPFLPGPVQGSPGGSCSPGEDFTGFTWLAWPDPLSRRNLLVPTSSKKKARAARKAPRRDRNGGDSITHHLSYKGTCFPPVLSTSFKYVSSVLNVSTSGTPGNWFFRLNSLYDPDASGTGGQPQWYTTLCSAGVYHQYRVLMCSYRVRFLNLSTTNAVDVALGCSDDMAGGVNPDRVSESYGGKSTLLAASGSAASFTTLSGSASIGRLFGVPDSVVRDESNFAAAYNANPASQAYLNCSIQSADATASVDVQLRVTLTYSVRLENLHRSSA